MFVTVPSTPTGKFLIHYVITRKLMEKTRHKEIVRWCNGVPVGTACLT